MQDPSQDNIFDQEVRRIVYDHTMQHGAPPSAATVAALTGPLERVQAAFQRLGDAHMLVLQRDTGEILMAAPFSAVPTLFPVVSGEGRWYGNCVWDALGIPAMLGVDAVVETTCGCCGTAMRLTVRDGQLVAPEGVIHFAVPAARWWDNIVFS